MYKAKLEVMNMISRRKNEDNRNYELLDDQSELLRDLNTYFPKLMTYLWEQPETVATIIKNANGEELKELAPLFANNFYDNILSPYYIEDNLMYVLALLLKDEINNLSNINQDESFLKNTPCGSILGELKRQNDIRSFFKKIIISSIENLEVNYSTVKINFSIIALVNEYNKLTKNDSKVKKKIKRDEGYLKYPDNDIFDCPGSDISETYLTPPFGLAKSLPGISVNNNQSVIICIHEGNPLFDIFPGIFLASCRLRGGTGRRYGSGMKIRGTKQFRCSCSRNTSEGSESASLLH